jgi:hypothetical protein
MDKATAFKSVARRVGASAGRVSRGIEDFGPKTAEIECVARWRHARCDSMIFHIKHVSNRDGDFSIRQKVNGPG